MRLRPDDELYRVNTVWLGPKGLTLPWSARYSAYGLALGAFISILLVEAALPVLEVGVPPVWEACLAVLFTYAVGEIVDHDRPLRSIPGLTYREVRRWSRTSKPRGANITVTARVKVVSSRPGPDTTTPAAPPADPPAPAPLRRDRQARAAKVVRVPRPRRPWRRLRLNIAAPSSGALALVVSAFTGVLSVIVR